MLSVIEIIYCIIILIYSDNMEMCGTSGHPSGSFMISDAENTLKGPHYETMSLPVI